MFPLLFFFFVVVDVPFFKEVSQATKRMSKQGQKEGVTENINLKRTLF
jgi:hypothetical protein